MQLEFPQHKQHEICEDPWYSCPKSGTCIRDGADTLPCDCGADRINAYIDQLCARIMEYEHALEHIAEDHEHGCPECRQLAQGALDGVNRVMCLELMVEGASEASWSAVATRRVITEDPWPDDPWPEE